MRIEAGELVRRIGDDQAQVKYSVAKRSRDQVIQCTIHIIHVEKTRSTGFLVYPQNRWQWFVSGLASKPLRWFLSLASKPRSAVWGLKIPTTVSWFEPQNQG
jgi:hypothetical protein